MAPKAPFPFRPKTWNHLLRAAASETPPPPPALISPVFLCNQEVLRAPGGTAPTSLWGGQQQQQLRMMRMDGSAGGQQTGPRSSGPLSEESVFRDTPPCSNIYESASAKLPPRSGRPPSSSGVDLLNAALFSEKHPKNQSMGTIDPADQRSGAHQVVFSSSRRVRSELP